MKGRTHAAPIGLGALRRSDVLRGLGALLGVLALALQLAAAALFLPMPAVARTPGVSAWLANALCLGSGVDRIGAKQLPGAPGHHAPPCPICSLAHLGGALLLPAPPTLAAKPMPATAPMRAVLAQPTRRGVEFRPQPRGPPATV